MPLETLFRDTIAALAPGLLVRTALIERPPTRAVTLLALGKAAVPMAEAAHAQLGAQVVTECVVAPEIPVGYPGSWIASSHPRVSADSVRAAQALLQAAREAKGEVIALISGGGSALAALPAGSLSLEQKSRLLQKVYAAGAAIEALNTVRKKLSRFKGGKLAQAASVPVTSYLLSDVVGDRLSTIASGPTIPDTTSFQDAMQVVQATLGCSQSCPASEFLRAGADTRQVLLPERPKDLAVLLAGLGTMAAAAHRLATERGMTSHILSKGLEGDIEQVAARILKEVTEPGLWIACAEATIVLPPQPGVGGRAQQLALLLASAIDGQGGVQILVAGSDGIDGNSTAAGALVDGATCQRLRDKGIAVDDALRNCDAGGALAQIGAQVRTGATHVNHADLILVHRTKQVG